MLKGLSNYGKETVLSGRAFVKDDVISRSVSLSYPDKKNYFRDYLYVHVTNSFLYWFHNAYLFGCWFELKIFAAMAEKG